MSPAWGIYNNVSLTLAMSKLLEFTQTMYIVLHNTRPQQSNMSACMLLLEPDMSIFDKTKTNMIKGSMQ